MKVSDRYHSFQRPSCIIRRWCYNWYCCSLNCRQVLSRPCPERAYFRATLPSPQKFTRTVYMLLFLLTFICFYAFQI